MRHNPPVNTAELFRLWNSDMENGDIVKALGISRYQLWVLGRRYGLGPRRHIQSLASKEARPDNDPTEAEYEQRKLEVQALWSPAEREKRRVGPTARQWSLPSYAYDGRVCSFVETALD